MSRIQVGNLCREVSRWDGVEKVVSPDKVPRDAKTWGRSSRGREDSGVSTLPVQLRGPARPVGSHPRPVVQSTISCAVETQECRRHDRRTEELRLQIRSQNHLHNTFTKSSLSKKGVPVKGYPYRRPTNYSEVTLDHGRHWT